MDCLRALKARHKKMSRNKGEFLLHKYKQLYYEHAECPSRLLTLCLKQAKQLTSMDAIKDTMGRVVTCPEQVSKVLKIFYSQLYTSETTVDISIVDDFLNTLELPQLSPHQSSMLDTALMLQELEEAVRAMNKPRDWMVHRRNLYYYYGHRLAPKRLLKSMNYLLGSDPFTET
ncbi:UNVERIFIED_CONTAM: hypothetical protein FKN15_035746 [Acipenser sinensis]